MKLLDQSGRTRPLVGSFIVLTMLAVSCGSPDEPTVAPTTATVPLDEPSTTALTLAGEVVPDTVVPGSSPDAAPLRDSGVLEAERRYVSTDAFGTPGLQVIVEGAPAGTIAQQTYGHVGLGPSELASDLDIFSTSAYVTYVDAAVDVVEANLEEPVGLDHQSTDLTFPEDIFEWLIDRPFLDATEPRATTFSGLPARTTDVVVQPLDGLEPCPGSGGRGCVALFNVGEIAILWFVGEQWTVSEIVTGRHRVLVFVRADDAGRRLAESVTIIEEPVDPAVEAAREMAGALGQLEADTAYRFRSFRSGDWLVGSTGSAPIPSIDVTLVDFDWLLDRNMFGGLPWYGDTIPTTPGVDFWTWRETAVGGPLPDDLLGALTSLPVFETITPPTEIRLGDARAAYVDVRLREAMGTRCMPFPSKPDVDGSCSTPIEGITDVGSDVPTRFMLVSTGDEPTPDVLVAIRLTPEALPFVDSLRVIPKITSSD